MDNSSIIISIVIVLCIAAGVTAYGLTNDSNTVFNDLSGFTPDEQGNTGIGNNSTGLEGADSGTGTGTSSGSGTGSSRCYSVKYNSHGYYTCLLKDAKGRTGYVLVGSGTGTILEGAWSDEVVPDEDNKTSDSDNKSSSSQ